MDFDPTTAVPEDASFDPSSAVPDAPIGPAPIAPHENPVAQAQWAKASPLDRMKMLATNFFPQAIKTDAPIAADMLQAGGTALGAASPIPGGAMMGGALGNAIGQKLKMAAGVQDSFKPGQMAGAAALGMFGGSPASSMAVNAAKFAGSSLLGKTAETAIDESRLPTLGEAAIAAGSGAVAAPIMAMVDGGSGAAHVEAKKALYAVRDKTLADAREAGYVIPGSKVNPSSVNNALESFGGKAAIGQEATIRNQQITNDLAKRAIGLPANEAITPQAIQNIREEAGLAYQAVADLSPQAAFDLEALKQARSDANLQSMHYQRNADPSVLKQAQASQAQADALETKLEGYAVTAKKPRLVDELRDARILIAKTYQVENALNAADGNVSASVIGKQFSKGRPLTDKLATIGRFQQAFPAYARDASNIPAPGVSKLKSVASPALAIAGSHLGPAGAVFGAALPFMDNAARNAALSKTFQRSALAQPSYGIPRPDLSALLARFLTQQQGQRSAPPSGIDQFVPQTTQ